MNSDKLAQLADQNYLNLETYRKNGQGVQTPIWFAEDSGVLYAYTLANSGKVKRLRRNPRVRVVPCSARGKPKGVWVEATARIEDAAGTERGQRLLAQKYGWQKKIADLGGRLRKSSHVVITIHFD